MTTDVEHDPFCNNDDLCEVCRELYADEIREEEEFYRVLASEEFNLELMRILEKFQSSEIVVVL